ADGGVHVGLELGGGEGAVVDADVVDQSGEPFAPDAVAADAEGAGGGGDRSADGFACLQDAVGVDAQRGAVVGGGDVCPAVERGGAGAAQVAVGCCPDEYEGVGRSGVVAAVED